MRSSVKIQRCKSTISKWSVNLSSKEKTIWANAVFETLTDYIYIGITVRNPMHVRAWIISIIAKYCHSREPEKTLNSPHIQFAFDFLVISWETYYIVRTSECNTGISSHWVEEPPPSSAFLRGDINFNYSVEKKQNPQRT